MWNASTRPQSIPSARPEGVEELDLGGRRREEQPGSPGSILGQELPQPPGDMVGRGAAHGRPVREDRDVEPVALELGHVRSGTNTTKKT